MAAGEDKIPRVERIENHESREVRRVNPSSMLLRSSLVGLRANPHSSDEQYGLILKRLAELPLYRHSIFITSVHGGEGTTTTAANLAAALGRRGARVLLVELRLTEPSLLHTLGDPKDVVGLDEALLHSLPLDDCIFRLADGGMHVLAVKNALTEEEAAQQSGGLNDLLVWAEAQFDWVVLDCPPVTSSAWTRWFALNADPSLLVVRAGETPMRALNKVVNALKDHLAGVVLNDSH